MTNIQNKIGRRLQRLTNKGLIIEKTISESTTVIRVEGRFLTKEFYYTKKGGKKKKSVFLQILIGKKLQRFEMMGFIISFTEQFLTDGFVQVKGFIDLNC